MFLFKRKKKIAFFIDADASQPKVIPCMIEKLSEYGKIITKLAVGNWLKDEKLSESWNDIVNKYDIQVLKYTGPKKPGKNATDITLTIQAIELLNNKKVDIFAFYTRDSDFFPLYHHLKDKGLQIINCTVDNEVHVVPIGNTELEFTTLPTRFKQTTNDQQKSLIRKIIIRILQKAGNSNGLMSWTQIDSKLNNSLYRHGIRKMLEGEFFFFIKEFPNDFEMTYVNKERRYKWKYFVSKTKTKPQEVKPICLPYEQFYIGCAYNQEKPYYVGEFNKETKQYDRVSNYYKYRKNAENKLEHLKKSVV